MTTKFFMSMAASLALVGLSAAPASADTNTSPIATQQAAATAWLTPGTPSGTEMSQAPIVSGVASANITTTKSLSGTKTVVAAATFGTKGFNYKYYRGSFMLWTQDELQWYYTPTTIISSSGSQTCGYKFPNTCSNGGLTRTFKSSSQENWSGRNTAGIGSVSPWGNVNIAATTKVDKYQIYPNTNIKVIPG